MAIPLAVSDTAWEILEELDLFPLWDLYCPDDCQQCAKDEPHTGEPRCYIGWQSDFSADIRGGQSNVEGNVHKTLEEALVWVVENEKALKEEAANAEGTQGG